MQALREGARAALDAPSIFNTQPWRWQVDGATLRLWADRERQLMVADPQARLLTISCGVALHHARVALAAAGHQPAVQRLPDPGETDLLAEVRIAGRHEPNGSQVRLKEAIRLRRTDRRAFHRGVPAKAATMLVDAAESEQTHLHLIRPGEVAGPYNDLGAQYAVFFTDQDGPLDWIRAGEALSAVLLTATALGLGTAPMSDVTELSVTREQLRHLLAGIGVPQLAVRIGLAPPGTPPPVPRRPAEEVIYP
jgi:nitroreductase